MSNAYCLLCCLCSIITITHDSRKLCHEEHRFIIHALEPSATLLKSQVIETCPTIPHFRGIYHRGKKILLNQSVRHGGTHLQSQYLGG